LRVRIYGRKTEKESAIFCVVLCDVLKNWEGAVGSLKTTLK